MEKFGFSGLWKGIGSTVIGALLGIADALVVYLGKVELPGWVHVVVLAVAAALAFYKGKPPAPVIGSPP